MPREERSSRSLIQKAVKTQRADIADDKENLPSRASGRARVARNYYVAEAAPAPHVLRKAMAQATTGQVLMPSEVGADGEHHVRKPPPVAESATARKRARTTRPGFAVEEYSEGHVGYVAAKAEVCWAKIDEWANQERVVVRRSHLKRLLDFTTKILLVREPRRGYLVGIALLSEADNSGVCDSLHSERNPSLPLVKTARMGGYGPIHPSLVRGSCDPAFGLQPIDELVLICGQRGCGAAVMEHLRGRPRFLYASVVPGSVRVRTFYDKHFRPLAFERRDGEWPYVAWLG